MDEMVETAINKLEFRDIIAAQERLPSDGFPDVKEVIGALSLPEIVLFAYSLAIQHFYFKANECQHTSEEVISHFWEVIKDRFGLGEPEEGFGYAVRKNYSGFSLTIVYVPKSLLGRIDIYTCGSRS